MQKLVCKGVVAGLFVFALGLAVGGCAGYSTVVVAEQGPPGQVQAARSHYRNGMRQYERGFYRQAAVQFELAVQEDPSYWEAHFYLGECYRYLDDYDGSLNQYTIVLNLYHDPVWVSRVEYNIGVVYEGRGRYEDARSHYENSLSAQPEYGPAKRAKARLSSKKYKENDEGRKSRGRGHGRGKGRDD